MSRESSTRHGSREIQLLPPAIGLLAGLVVWWTAVRLALVPPVVVPSPSAVIDQLVAHPDLYASHAVATLRIAFLGGAVGIAGGVVLGVVLGSIPLLRRTLVPFLVAARVTPKIAVAPLLLLYLGTGEATALFFVALIAFFPATISTLAGFDRTPAAQLDLLATVDAGRLARLWHVRLPHAMPDVVAGIKQSVALSFVGAIVAEWIVGSPGLGYLLLIGAESVQPAVIVAALSVLFAAGLLLYGTVAHLLSRLAWTGAGSGR